MAWRKKLDEWRENGVVSPETVQAIEVYEARRPHLADHLWRYGLVGLAVLCVGLGIWFIVAANWQSIPFWAKLGTHVTLNAGLALWSLHGARRDAPKWAREIPLVLCAAAQLSLMALIGQHLHLKTPIEDVIAFWFYLIAPMLLLLGGTVFSAALFFGLGIYVVLSKLDFHLVGLFYPVYGCLILLYLLSLWPELRHSRAGWSQLLGIIGFYGIIFFTVALLIEPRLFQEKPYHYTAPRLYTQAMLLEAAKRSLWYYNDKLLALIALAGGLVANHWLKRRGNVRALRIHDAHAALIAWSLAMALAVQACGEQGEALEDALFCLYFIGIGKIAHGYRQSAFVSIAILCVAIRLVVYFASLLNNLLFTGVAMIVVGCAALYMLRLLVWPKEAIR